MKEKIIYTLLMTMIPGLSLAMDAPETPIKAKTKLLKEQVIKELPTTPQLKEQVNRGIRRDILPPKRADLFEKYGLDQEKRKRDSLKEEKFAAIENQALQERLEREKKQSQKRAEQQSFETEKLISEAKKATEEKFKANEMLSSMIADLKKTIDIQTQEIRDTREILATTEEFSDSTMKEMENEILTKTKNLTETTGQLRELELKAQMLELQLTIAKGSEEMLRKGLQQIASQDKGFSSSLSTPPLSSIIVSPSVPAASVSNTPVVKHSSSMMTSQKKLDAEEELPESGI